MKNKLIYLFAVLLFTFSCSVDRMQETIVIEGIDGSTTLVNVTTLPEGSEACPAGGTQLAFGIDIDGDGSLSEDEVTSSASVCNGVDGIDGVDGTSALVEVTPIQPNEEYPNGAVLITNGYDLNKDGILQEDEIAGTTVVENGADGTNGTNGTNGADGFTTLVRTTRILSDTQTEEEVESPCPLGGFLIESGLDSNRDGVLQDSEVNDSSTTYVCDGEDGKSLAIRVEFLDSENQFCSNGGYLVTIGLDQNGDGELDFAEALNGTSFPVCDGQDGIDGYNSLSSSEKVTDEEGNIIGYIIFTGLDLNRNDVLEETERTSSFTVFNGTDGEDGTDGFSTLISMNEVFDPEIGVTFVDLSSGRDLNRDGILQESEWEFTTQIYNGVNGLDGRDGQDGRSVDVRYELTETGTIVIFGYLVESEFIEINRIFVSNGVDGTNGTNGTNGEDGKSVTVKITNSTSEECSNGGVDVQMLQGETIIEEFTLCNGEDGTDGTDGEDGVCDECEKECEEGTVTICHTVTHKNNIPQEWVDKDYVTLELTLSEYVQHRFEYHNGNSSQQDSWGECEPEFVPVTLCIKVRTGNGLYFGFSYQDVVVESQSQYDYYFNEYVYKHGTREGSCND